MLQNLKKRALRRAYPIHGYVGANGGGKSAAMVWDTLPSLDAGRPVLSTVRLLDFRNPRECEGCDDPNHTRPIFAATVRTTDDEGNTLDAIDPLYREVVGYRTHMAAHPLWVPFHDWQQLLDAKSMDVLLDEVTGVASSRESMGLPAAVANQLVQLRRSDVIIRWSAPAWARADKIIRETSQSATFCIGRMAKKAPTSDEGADRAWRQRRLFNWRTYDASAFDDFTSGKRESLRPEVRDLHWGPGSPAFLAYDTYDSVNTIGTVSETGRCYRCGGTRRAPACSCSEHSRPGRNSTAGTRGPRGAGARAPVEASSD